MKHFSIVIIVLAACVLLSVPARAHAHLDRASPAVGSTVAAAPAEVVLWFTDDLEPAFSSIEVRNASGAAMHADRSSVDPKQRTQMRVPLKPLPPGTYKVIWRVLTVDTHRMQGDFSFRVGP